MLTKFSASFRALSCPLRHFYRFDVKATEYYDLLGLQTKASQEQIREAFAFVTKDMHPDTHQAELDLITQAFVILTDPKARDAYDSLLHVRKTSYINDPETGVVKKSYLSEKRAVKMKELQKKMNLDQFGRYKGGLPTRYSKVRKNSFRTTGEMHLSDEIEEVMDQQPDFPSVTAQKADSFKNFINEEKVARQMMKRKTLKQFKVVNKYPWFPYVKPRYLLIIRSIKLGLLAFYVFPAFYYLFKATQKDRLTQQLRKHAVNSPLFEVLEAIKK